MWLISNVTLILFASITFQSLSIFIIGNLFLALGNLLINIGAKCENKIQYSHIFNLCFFVYLLYAVVCYFYMDWLDYKTLLVSDSITAYIPYTERFIKMNSFSEMWNTIYNNSVTGKYAHTGIILIYFAMVGKIAYLFDNELFFNLQISLLFLSSFISVFVYKLLHDNEIKNSYRWTLIYSFLSINFYYSTLILRDIPIALLYLIVFCHIFNRYSLKNLCIIVLCVLVIWGIRPQNGLFILLYLLTPFVKDRFEIKETIFVITIVLLIGFIFFKLEGMDMYEQNQTGFYNRLQIVDSTSVLNKFNLLPPIISHAVKVIYILLSPIPCWSFMAIGTSANELNNLLGFPRAIGTYYNYIILGFILFGLRTFFKSDILQKYKYSLLISLLFIALQSNSTELRRIMLCFPILLLYSTIVIDNMPPKTSHRVIEYMTLIFVIAQIIGMTKYL